MAANKSTFSYGVKELSITKFRNMEKLTIPIGGRITVIAGQNGTGKSTILGMLGQPFGLTEEKTVFDRSFATKFSDIFNLSPLHDKPGEHIYHIDFNDDSISKERPLQVKSYVRTNAKSHIRFVAGATRGEGDGNIDFPVIYLGLRRTYPLGEFRDPKSYSLDLSDQESEQFARWYSQVIIPTNQTDIFPVGVKQDSRKNTFLVNTDDYDYLANSAGQDNLGQILAAVMSFKRLKEKLDDEYVGGLLLIDELDVTLFPASQKRVLDILYDASPELKLQTIFTTHSLNLIEHAKELQAKDKAGVTVAYLQNRKSGVNAIINPSFLDIECDLEIKPYPKKVKPEKVELWCEDAEAKWFISRMLPASLSRKCNIIASGLSCGELDNLAIKPLKSLENVVFIVDGDANKNPKKQLTEHTRRLAIPGGDVSPEQSIYNLLSNLTDEDDFWSNEFRYGKQTFLSSRNDSIREFERKNGKLQRKMNKNWFNKEKASGVWGQNGSNVYAIWAKQYENEIDSFCKKLEIIVDRIIRRRDGMAKVERKA